MIQEQADFRSRKSYSGQILNMTQFIENSFEKKKRTGVDIIDLIAAYGTVSHRILLNEIYNLTKDNMSFTQIIKALF